MTMIGEIWQWINAHWPGICAAVALAALLILVIRYQVHAFLALLAVSVGLGFAAGLTPGQIIEAIQTGIAGILREVLLLLALGALLGRLLETSGAAELIARRIMQAFGERNTSFAILLAAYLVGIPILFNVGFLVLIPIIWRLQRETNRSLLYFLLPLSFSLGITHSLVPPHPGIVGAVTNIAGKDEAGRVMVETIIFGIALSFPLALFGWFGPGRFWAQRQFVEAPAGLAGDPNKAGTPLPDPNLASAVTAGPPSPIAAAHAEQPVARSFALALAIILAPLILSIAGFGVKLLDDLHQLPDWTTGVLFEKDYLPRYLHWLNHSVFDWLQFLGRPTVALFVPTALAFAC